MEHPAIEVRRKVKAMTLDELKGTHPKDIIIMWCYMPMDALGFLGVEKYEYMRAIVMLHVGTRIAKMI